LISVMEHLAKLNSLLLNADTTKEGEGV
jgi:hypothetical protein